MTDQIQKILNLPRDFVEDGMQFLNRSQEREFPQQDNSTYKLTY